MGQVLRRGIRVNDQFFDDNQVEPTNSACGAAAVKSIYDYYYPDKYHTLLEIIRMTPLLKFIKGSWVHNQSGLTCEQVMALCWRLGLQAHLEVMTPIILKSYLDRDIPVIILEDDRDIALFSDGVMLRQDHSGGFHFVVAVDHGLNPKGHPVIYTIDSDRVDPHTNFGQDVPVPEAMLIRAMYDSDQRNLCIVVDSKLSVQVDRITHTVVPNVNFRIRSTVQSFAQFQLLMTDQVEVLHVDPVIADGHTWLQCRVREYIGSVASELLIKS